jgi:defect-in-organelle-trafficking protein DotD
MAFKGVKIRAVSALVLAGLAGSLGACNTVATVDPNAELALRAAGQEAATRLSESAERAAAAQAELARIQEARTKPAPRPFDETLAGVPQELRRAATIEWSGPAVEAARRVADIVGYRFVVVGNPPATPPMVNVSLREVPAAKALEDIGLQAQPFGQVVADPNRRVVEFRYLSPAGGAAVSAARAAVRK